MHVYLNLYLNPTNHFETELPVDLLHPYINRYIAIVIYDYHEQH